MINQKLNTFGAAASLLAALPLAAFGQAPASSDLSSAAASFANLVNVSSVQQPSLLRVAPGDADASYLVQKIEGTAAVGSRMPLGGGALDAATIDAIRAWIDSGAEQ